MAPSDIQSCVNQILGRSLADRCGDVNLDLSVDVLDAQVLINWVLAGRSC